MPAGWCRQAGAGRLVPCTLSTGCEVRLVVYSLIHSDSSRGIGVVDMPSSCAQAAALPLKLVHGLVAGL
jgi:hypothetical protein